MPDPVSEPMRLEALRQMRLHEMREDQTLAHFAQLACDAFAVPMAGISIVDGHHQWFIARVGIARRAAAFDDSLCADVVRSGDLLVVPDLQADPCYRAHPAGHGAGTAPGVRFYAGAPLRTRAGLVLGTVCLMDTVPHAEFGSHERRLLASMARTVSVRIEANRDTGLVDPMTLMPNRTRFLADIDTLQRGPAAAQVVVLVELCSREYLHDMAKALGQDHADQYLVHAADRLHQAITPQRMLYRVSTTAFAFVHGHEDDAAMEAAFQRLTDFFAVAFDFQGIPHTARVAIGAIRLGQVAGAAELLRALVALADQLRQQGRAWGFYERTGDEAQQRAFQLLSALGGALAGDDGQLALHYQPRLDLRTGACVGFEALLRWDHPLLGKVPPAEFIPLAEKTALISQVTRRVLQMALEQSVRWNAAGHAVDIAVNVSAVDLDQPEFVDDLLRQMARCGADARRIELECTESALSVHPERFQAHLRRLREHGVRLAIDDFGTGYSNIAYLKNIPAQLVKIDRSFVSALDTDARDRIIVTTLIRMARELGLRVVAEGVETPEVLALLADWGCDEAQGYWIARPMPVEAAEAWLRAHPARLPADGAAAAARADLLPATAPDRPAALAPGLSAGAG
jgi:EAL domain-containing protein (putative c-di-GMP-specific phosphodiesterase class I)/GGDEF domain-containing protein